MGGFGIDFWLVFLNPLDLGGCQAWTNRITVDFHHLFIGNNSADRLAGFCGTGIVPKNRAAQRLSCRVQHDRAHHLAGHPDSLDGVSRDTGFVNDIAHGGDGSCVPVLRVLFGPAVIRLVNRVFLRHLRDFLPVLIKQYGFDTAGPQIQSN